MPGGISWTKNWLIFDNSYFFMSKQNTDKELLCLPTDMALMEAPEFKEHFRRFAESQPLFFADYATAHKKFSELGVRWIDSHPQGIIIDESSLQ